MSSFMSFDLLKKETKKLLQGTPRFSSGVWLNTFTAGVRQPSHTYGNARLLGHGVLPGSHFITQDNMTFMSTALYVAPGLNTGME